LPAWRSQPATLRRRRTKRSWQAVGTQKHLGGRLQVFDPAKRSQINSGVPNLFAAALGPSLATALEQLAMIEAALPSA